MKLTGAQTNRRSERGMTIIELMIAGVVLAVGLGGLAVLFSGASTSAKRNKVDTGATMVAKLVLEQITSQDPSITTDITITDCGGTSSGTAWTIKTQGATGTTGNGATLMNTSSSLVYGGIDFTQAYSAVPSGYAMKYKDCQGDKQTTYDVRWNIITTSTMTSGTVTTPVTRMVTVAARQVGNDNTNIGNQFFAVPVNLRTVGGPYQ